MSERLTDEQLEGMSRWMEERDLPAFAMYCGPRAAAEIRARRSLDLTAAEVEALVNARDILNDADILEWDTCIRREIALSTLDRLTRAR